MKYILLLVGFVFGAADKISYPYDFLTIPSGNRAALSGNFESAKTAVNNHADTLDVYLSAKGKSGTGKVLYSIDPVTTGLTTADSLKVVAGVRLSGLTASQAVFTDAEKKLQSISVSGTGSVVMSSSPAISGTANIANAVFSGTLTLSALTANTVLQLDGSKNIISNSITGSGSLVATTSPTISSPNISSASITTATLNGTITNNGTISGGTGNFTTLQQGGVQAVTTSGTQTLTNKSISASQITNGTFGTGNYGISGDLTFSNPSNALGTFRGVNGVIADNDAWYVGGRVGSGSNDGQLYLGTNDDGNEPIVFGTGNPSTPTQWANIQSTGVTSINGLYSNSGQIRANNAGGQGTYLELAKYQGALPGYPTLYFPVLKTDFTDIFFSANGKYLGSVYNDNIKTGISFQNNNSTATDIYLATDGVSSFIRTGKFGIGNNSPDSTLTVSGSGRFTGNTRVEGNFTANAFRSLDGSAYFDTTITLTWDGFSTNGNGKLRFIKIGKQVTMEIDTVKIGNSNSTLFRKTSIIPSSLRPAIDVKIPTYEGSPAENAGFGCGVHGLVYSTGQVDLYPFYRDAPDDIDVWVNSGTKGLTNRISITWFLP